MKNALNSIKVEAPRNNAFDLTHDVKLTCNMGELIPVLALDLVPGDRVRIRNEAMLRFLPMLAPIMHRVDVSFHTFFVPNRLVWEKWETWITNGGDAPSGVSTPLPAHPYTQYGTAPGGPTVGFYRLMDFMGLPNPAVAGNNAAPEKVSALPFGAYQLIYDEYYRDENLQDKVFTGLNDGVNNSEPLYTIRKRCWEADYFTKALPFAQKGQAVDVPLGNVELNPAATGVSQLIRNASDHSLSAAGNLETDAAGELSEVILGTAFEKVLDPNGTLMVGATTINDLRLAYRLQEWLERNARGGTRYSELIKSHFGVTSPDARLQRPEYVCGTKTPVQISEVLSNVATSELPQGEMAGHGISYTGGKPGKYFATEHGYLMTLMSIMPKTAYMQGIPKSFLKINDPSELFWPSFSHLGEQEVQNKEIYAFQGATGDDTFGYQSRYMEYKNLPNRACTEMQTTLDYWNMVRKFSAAPALNSTFVTANPTTRIFAVTDEEIDHLVVQVLNSIMAIRPMPVYGTPTF